MGTAPANVADPIPGVMINPRGCSLVPIPAKKPTSSVAATHYPPAHAERQPQRPCGPDSALGGSAQSCCCALWHCAVAGERRGIRYGCFTLRKPAPTSTAPAREKHFTCGVYLDSLGAHRFQHQGRPTAAATAWSCRPLARLSPPVAVPTPRSLVMRLCGMARPLLWVWPYLSSAIRLSTFS